MGKLIWKLALILIIPLAVASMNFVIDPLQYYRRADWYLPRFYDQQRFQMPAIARTFTYDTIIMGTSMSENISIGMLQEEFGMTAIRGTMSGSSAFEQRMGLEVALRTGQVRNVIWDLNFLSFSGETNEVRDRDAAFPFHLYDGRWWTDFRYLLDPTMTRRSWHIITNRLPYNELLAAQELEILNKWGRWSLFGEDIVRYSWERQTFEAGTEMIEKHGITRTMANLEENVLPLVAANPDITFRFYFPPFSVLEYVTYAREGIFEAGLIWRLQTFDALRDFPNVQIFDFQAEREIITNFDLYMDRAHHNLEVTDWVVREIMRGEQVTREQILENNRAIRAMMNEFYDWQ